MSAPLEVFYRIERGEVVSVALSEGDQRMESGHVEQWDRRPRLDRVAKPIRVTLDRKPR